jgi:hypothetical protein
MGEGDGVGLLLCKERVTDTYFHSPSPPLSLAISNADRDKRNSVFQFILEI